MYSESTDHFVSGQNKLNREVRVQQGKHGAGLREGLITLDRKREGNTVAFSWHLKTPAPQGQRPRLFWARASVFRPYVGGAGRVPAASVRVAAAAGPFVPAGRRRRLSAPSERPPWGQRGPHRLAPPTSQLQPGPPQLPVPPSLPGPKNDLVLLFGFGREGRACPGPGAL